MAPAARLGFRERQAARTLDFCAVYLVRPLNAATASRSPVKIAIASDVTRRLNELQTGSWETLEAFRVYWFAGKPLALRVGNLAETYLVRKARRLNGDWFELESPQAAASLIEKAATTLAIPWFDDAERRRRLAAEVSTRIERATKAVYGSR